MICSEMIKKCQIQQDMSKIIGMRSQFFSRSGGYTAVLHWHSFVEVRFYGCFHSCFKKCMLIRIWLEQNWGRKWDEAIRTWKRKVTESKGINFKILNWYFVLVIKCFFPVLFRTGFNQAEMNRIRSHEMRNNKMP